MSKRPNYAEGIEARPPKGEQSRSERRAASLAVPPENPAIYSNDAEGAERIQFFTRLIRIFVGPVMAISAVLCLTTAIAFALPTFFVCLALFLTTDRVLKNGGMWPRLGALMLGIMVAAMALLMAFAWRAVLYEDNGTEVSVIGVAVVLTLWIVPFVGICASMLNAQNR